MKLPLTYEPKIGDQIEFTANEPAKQLIYPYRFAYEVLDKDSKPLESPRSEKPFLVTVPVLAIVAQERCEHWIYVIFDTTGMRGWIPLSQVRPIL